MFDTYDDYKRIIDKHLLDYLPLTESKAITIYEAMKYSLLSGGKRLRPVMLLAACDFAGGDIYEALPYACAIEYIHTYSLIHDDLPAMDDDDLRRGNPTNHMVYGEGMAVLAGDALLNSANEVMFRDLTYYFDNSTKLKRHIRSALKICKSAGVKGMIAGQVSDIESQFKECSVEMIEFIDANKTSALLNAAITAGLYIGGADQAMLERFNIYSEKIGMAFQISDDILDVIGEEKKLGKKVNKDKDKGKCSYVCINGIENSKQKLHQLTTEAIEVIDCYYDNAEFFKTLAVKLETRNA